MTSHSLGARTAQKVPNSSNGGSGMGGAEWAAILSSAISGMSSLSKPESGIKSKEVKRRLYAELLERALMGENKARNTELNSNQFMVNQRAQSLRNAANEAIYSARGAKQYV